MTRLWLCLFSTLLAVAGCAAPFSWTRTTDQFSAETRTYYNKSVPLKVSFPDGWMVVVKPETSKYSPWVPKAEKQGIEVAMVAEHPSRLAHVIILIEPVDAAGIFSPIEYVAILKQLEQEATVKEIFLEERDLNGIRVAHWKYEASKDGRHQTNQELVFLTNRFACRIRCYANSSLYHKFKPTFEEIIQSVSISHE